MASEGPSEATPAVPATRRRLRAPGRGTLLRLAGAAAAGALLYLSFPPHTLWWLAPVAFALLGVVLHERRAWPRFGYGLVFGLAFFLPLVFWLEAFLGVDFGSAPWLGVCAVEGLLIALSVAVTAFVRHLPAAPVWMAALIVGGEALRSRFPLNGFPWGRVGFGQADGPYLVLASVGGAPLVCFAVALTGFAAAHLLLRGRGVAVPVALVVLPLVAGLALGPTVGTAAQAGTLRVAVVQGNAPDLGLRLIRASEQIRENHLAATRRLAALIRAGRVPRPELLLWPETATDVGPDPAADTALADALAEVGVPALLGVRRFGPAHTVTNSVLQWDPRTGPGARYDKHELVPFAEYVPLRAIASWFTPFLDDASNMTPGSRPGVFHVAGTTVGTAICYEIAYDYPARDSVAAGARLLVVPTNNAWYGHSGMSEQQLGMARLRAVEHGRAVVVASTSGVSAMVAPDGTVYRRTALFTADDLVATVPLRSATTVADKLGPWSEWLLCGMGAVALLAGVVPGARRRVWSRRYGTVRTPGGVPGKGE